MVFIFSGFSWGRSPSANERMKCFIFFSALVLASATILNSLSSSRGVVPSMFLSRISACFSSLRAYCKTPENPVPVFTFGIIGIREKMGAVILPRFLKFPCQGNPSPCQGRLSDDGRKSARWLVRTKCKRFCDNKKHSLLIYRTQDKQTSGKLQKGCLSVFCGLLVWVSFSG